MRRLQSVDHKNFDEHALRLLTSQEACNDLIDTFDDIARDEILDLATMRVQGRVEAESWLCFELMHVEKLSGEEVARRLQKTRHAVFNNVYRVRKMLKDEILAIDSEFQF